MTNGKLLFISCWNPTPDNPKNGVFIRRHGEALRSSGIELDYLAIHICTSSKMLHVRYTEEIGELNLYIESFAWKFIYTLYPLLLWIVRKYLTPKLAAKNYTHVVSNVIHPTAVIGADLASQFELPHVIIEHFSKTEFLLKHWLFGKRLKQVYKKANLVIPVSGFLEKMIKKHLPGVHTRVVPNVVDTSVFALKPSDNTGNKTIKFVAVAHWHQTKREIKLPALLISALSKLQEERKDLNIEIEFIGDGNLIDSMKASTETNRLNAKFAGTQGAEYISEALHRANFFVHASTIETFSVVTVEALCSGTPVIASNVGALPELINNTNGLLADNDIDSWCRCLSKALETTYDRVAISKAVTAKYNSDSVGRALGQAIMSNH